MWNDECGMMNVECGMWNDECGMMNVECGMWNDEWASANDQLPAARSQYLNFESLNL